MSFKGEWLHQVWFIHRDVRVQNYKVDKYKTITERLRHV